MGIYGAANSGIADETALAGIGSPVVTPCPIEADAQLPSGGRAVSGAAGMLMAVSEPSQGRRRKEGRTGLFLLDRRDLELGWLVAHRGGEGQTPNRQPCLAEQGSTFFIA